MVRGNDEQVLQIVEDADASEKVRAISEVNVGTYVVDGSFLFKALDELDPKNAQGELYLTDIIQKAVDQGFRVSAMVAHDTQETMGINNREHLALAEKHMRHRISAKWMHAGVTVVDPDQTSIDDHVLIGQDTTLYPGVSLEGHTRIGAGCVIRANTRITDSTIGDQVLVQDSCVVNGAVVDSGSVVGPFAHLRPGTRLRNGAKVGNFVELKQAELGKKSKANHLSYLGDTTVGEGVNIGAGTITCNYDGYRKEQTIIEDEVFIGSDTQLIAPVRVGRGAIVAAGTTLTQDVPPNALGISRQAQVNKQGAAAAATSHLCPAAGSSIDKENSSSIKSEKRKVQKIDVHKGENITLILSTPLDLMACLPIE